MIRRELVQAAIRHQPTERCPYFIRLTPEAQQFLIEDHGIEDPYAWLDNDVETVIPPWWTWHDLEDDWRGMDPPTSRAHTIGRGSYTDFVDTIKRLRDTTDKYVLVVIYGSHFEKAQFARGFENCLADIGGEYEFAKRLHQTIIGRNLVMLENILHLSEIDGVLLGSDWGSQRGLLISPTIWDDLIRPGEQAEYDLIHEYGKDVWVHSCGSIEPLLSRLVEMGVDVLNPLQPECMDIAAIKRGFGQELCFWGGVSTQQTLPFGSPEEVVAEARRVRDMLHVGSGYIFSPAQDIQGDVPFENIRALRDVARERIAGN